MTEKDFYIFDSLGVCIGRNLVQPQVINHVNGVINNLLNGETPYKFPFLEADPAFMELLVHPWIMASP